jgi:hypothetical protein
VPYLRFQDSSRYGEIQREIAHLSNCALYLEGNTFTSKFDIWGKHELGFLQGLGALGKETPSKKRLEGGERRGKRQV